MGRSDLIGNGKRHLIPIFQPPGTGMKAEAMVRRDAREARDGAAGRPQGGIRKPAAGKAGGQVGRGSSCQARRQAEGAGPRGTPRPGAKPSAAPSGRRRK